MTIFDLDLTKRNGLKYRAIADALADRIANGQMAPGERLPTHRDLAWRLGVTVGTVSRAYAEMARRDLLSGEIGRGTFVRSAPTPSDLPHRPMAEPGMIDLTLNFPPPGTERQELSTTLAEMAGDPDCAALLDYQPDIGLSQHRAAGAAWITRNGWPVAASRIVVTAGTQHGILTTLATLTRPGDRIVAECLSYQGVKPVAALLGLRLDGLAIDGEGLIPDAFERAARDGGVRALYCMASLHNPTTATMPEARRRDIADIARRYGIAIIEDDIYGAFAEPARPLSDHAGDLGYYLTGLSKTVAPGLRIGYIVAPEDKVDALGASVRASCWMAAPLMAELASRWIATGAADTIMASHKRAAADRQALARKILKNANFQSPPGSLHLWLHPPEPWRAGEFVAAMRQQGVAIAPAEIFAIGRGGAPHSVRVCLGAPRDESDLKTGLERIAAMLEKPPAALPIRV